MKLILIIEYNPHFFCNANMKIGKCTMIFQTKKIIRQEKRYV